VLKQKILGLGKNIAARPKLKKKLTERHPQELSLKLNFDWVLMSNLFLWEVFLLPGKVNDGMD